MKYPNIASRVFHTPLLAAPSKAISFVQGLGPRILGQNVEIEGVEGFAEVAPSRGPQISLLDDRVGEQIRSGRAEPFRMIDGVAVIPITGTLIHRGSYVGSYSGETSYEGLSAQIEAAAESRQVRGIALEIDSYGGQVAGCFDLADLIREVGQDKPVHAFVCDHAYSAAYAIASQAERIVVSRTGGAGSIGVICLHKDYSGQLEARGINVSVISAGAHKGDENPFAPLPDSVRSDMEEQCEYLRQIFAETVGAGRGASLTAAAALETEARCFIGQQALAAGLVDEVANPRDAFERFVAQINGRAESPSGFSSNQRGEDPMTDKTSAPKEADTPTAAPTGSTPIAAPEAPTTPPVAQAAPAPAQPLASEERARIGAILNSEEAKGREDLAKSFAFDSDMDAETAKKHLDAAPKATATQSLSASMDANGGAADLDMPDEHAGASTNPVKDAQRARRAS
ncbi:S49 family peptidase [uncultured Sulfitobacter sp.]|uniref:S49 family peptidase n=1 Tax=uncultured Sulfitobacter sp. TaxID=191468 RepID=UPI00262A6849|nr:S49 family peptidase [uncultured Sulfitobacter sp.]